MKTVYRWILVLIATAALAACGMTPTTDAPSTGESPAPSEVAGNDPLLTVEFRGGMCVAGSECKNTLVITEAGEYSYTLGQSAPQTGTIDAGTIATLEEQMAAADFEEIKAQPFTGTCPLAFDGPELVYTFHTDAGDQTLESCSVGIDENSPLFQTVGAIIATAQQQAS